MYLYGIYLGLEGGSYTVALRAQVDLEVHGTY